MGSRQNSMEKGSDETDEGYDGPPPYQFILTNHLRNVSGFKDKYESTIDLQNPELESEEEGICARTASNAG
ncbi:uncharacterized protein N7482_007642 [Penicillium canariense]|uniref:Uncharacterized protein n=1 Tax=Penicillium canariense TaxID=189055 RepID=A0A9W9LKH4_9EURO|nr:uncharacterized protein N7482_007642 [Penicillium canariense]KAJ5160638.1 hypothetical protein N7482_007642 [Penicillium canariense]